MKKHYKICKINIKNIFKIIIFAIFVYPFVFKKQKQIINLFLSYCFTYKRNDKNTNNYNEFLTDLNNKNIKEVLINKKDIIEFDILLNGKGKNISCLKVLNSKKTNNWVIGLHGWTENKYLALRLTQQFTKLNYNILTFDSFAHGSTYGKYTDIGLSSIVIIDKIIEYIKIENPNAKIVLIGNSMGASSSLLYCQKGKYKNYISHVIADCGFSNLVRQLRFVLEEQYKTNWWKIGLNLTNSYNKKIKTNIRKYDLLKNMNDISSKILLIHGKNDEFINYKMAHELYNKYKNKKNIELWIPNNGPHVRIISLHSKEYFTKVSNFIKK